MDGERAQARAAAASRAAADLRGSNAALTAELARVRAEGEREGGALRTELASLAGRFKAEQVASSVWWAVGWSGESEWGKGEGSASGGKAPRPPAACTASNAHG